MTPRTVPTPDADRRGPDLLRTRRGVEGVVRLFDRVSASYDLPWLQRAIYRPAHDDIVSALERYGARIVADIGCGTGILACRIAAELQPEEICGIDMSPGMLAKATARCPQLDWRRGAAERLPLVGESVDTVVVTTAFHFFDQPAALAEFRRVLRPNGVLAISVINFRLRWLSRASGARWCPAYGPTWPQMRTMVDAAGFELLEQRPIRRPWQTRCIPDVLIVAKRR